MSVDDDDDDDDDDDGWLAGWLAAQVYERFYRLGAEQERVERRFDVYTFEVPLPDEEKKSSSSNDILAGQLGLVARAPPAALCVAVAATTSPLSKALRVAGDEGVATEWSFKAEFVHGAWWYSARGCGCVCVCVSAWVLRMDS